MSHRDEDTMTEILNRMPRYKLSDEKMNEHIESISRRINRKTFSVIRGFQIAVFGIAAIVFIVLVPLTFNPTQNDQNGLKNPTQSTNRGEEENPESEEQTNLSKEEKLLQSIGDQFKGIAPQTKNNGIVIDEDGTMIEREKGAEPEPSQYKSVIKGLILDIGPEVVSPEEEIEYILKSGRGVFGGLERDRYEGKLRRVEECLEYAREISPELEEYLKETHNLLKDGLNDQDNQKLAEGVKRIFDLHGVLFSHNE